MRRIDFKDVAELELKYPLFFQKDYAKYEQTKGWTVQLYTDGSAYLPVKIKAGKFIKQAHYLFPPLQDGKHLSEEVETAFLEKFKFWRKKK